MGSNSKAEFDVIYRKYKDDVLRMAVIKTNNLHTAEDITQEVFLKYYLYTLNSEVKKPRNWLLSLSKNLSINHLKLYRYEIVMNLREAEEEFQDAEADPEYIFFDKLWKSDSLACSGTILTALKEKNENWYWAVTGVFCLGRKRQEVADIMGISADALDGLLKRAKNWIEKNYSKEYDRIACK